MNKLNTKARMLPLTVDIDLDDDVSVGRAAEALGTTTKTVRATLGFAQVIMARAEDNDLTTGQLITAVLSVMAVLVKDCGDEAEQREMCTHLFEGLWASVGLPSDGPAIPSPHVH
jgi:hypothetical protein